MKKTVVYIIILAALSWAVYYFVFRDRDAFSGDEAGFTIADTSAIAKIFMADKRGNTILLERKNGSWLLNNQYPVMNQPVSNILYTLMSQGAQYPVAQHMRDGIIKMLAGEGVKVEVYDADGDKMRVFYVAGQANNNAGSYMLMQGSETPYVVQIPGFPGYIATRYSTNIADWRDRSVFTIPKAEINTISIKYPDAPLNNFTIRRDAAGGLTADIDPALSAGKQVNKRRVDVFSAYFEKLYSEGYINGTIKLDSVIKSVPLMCVIEASTKQGKTQKADIYLMPLNRRSKNMLSPFPGLDNNYDADRFYAVINNAKDTVIIQRFTFDKVFRKAYEFYEADDTTRTNQVIEIPKGAGNVIKVGSGK
ncbi:MAG: DUF4340 domain-containing protein [Flavipsychrobacter sp.]|nr:DUF4340 domain-containing protein [Flavipsychrobacter sp.]